MIEVRSPPNCHSLPARLLWHQGEQNKAGYRKPESKLICLPMRCASFIQPTIEECEAKSKAPTAAEKRDRIMKQLKAGEMVYHWKDEGWLEADF